MKIQQEVKLSFVLSQSMLFAQGIQEILPNALLILS